MDTRANVESYIAEKSIKFPSGMADRRLLPGQLPFVTVTSQSGAGGHRFSEKLLELVLHEGSTGSDMLEGWRIFDKSMCQEVLEKEHLSKSIEELLHEDYHSQISEFVLGIFGDLGMQNVAYMRLSQLLRTIASVGKVIILGHGGCMATSALAGGLHVRLVAPLASRAKRMAPILELDEAQTIQQIRQRDESQRKLLKTHYRIDSADPEHYDLVFNTDRMSPDTAAELLLVMLRKKVGQE